MLFKWALSAIASIGILSGTVLWCIHCVSPSADALKVALDTRSFTMAQQIAGTLFQNANVLAGYLQKQQETGSVSVKLKFDGHLSNISLKYEATGPVSCLEQQAMQDIVGMQHLLLCYTDRLNRELVARLMSRKFQICFGNSKAEAIEKAFGPKYS